MGTAIHGASTTIEKSMIPNGMETKYPATRPQITGMSFRVPRAIRNIKMVVASDINATSRPTSPETAKMPLPTATPKAVCRALLREPTPADWSTDPMETLSVVLIPHVIPMEHWFLAALQRKAPEEALEIARQMGQEAVPALIIDTTPGDRQRICMPRIAEALGTKYQHIDNLQAGQVLQLIEMRRPASR